MDAEPQVYGSVTEGASHEARDIEYYHRTMTSLLGRKDYVKANRVLNSIHEHDPVRLSLFGSSRVLL